MPMTDVKNKKVKKPEEREIAGTLFTVHSVRSDEAKKSIKEILKNLILNNVDSADLSA